MATVSTHSRLKAAGQACVHGFFKVVVSTHSRLKAAGEPPPPEEPPPPVSTHSRLKAAGYYRERNKEILKRFNTQPPKGGWCPIRVAFYRASSFNTQPPKGGWCPIRVAFYRASSFNTQPPKGGWTKPLLSKSIIRVSTHSRLKAAGGICSMI